MQRGKLLSEAVQEWVTSIIKEGGKFILDLTTAFIEGEVLLGEFKPLCQYGKLTRTTIGLLCFKLMKLKSMES